MVEVKLQKTILHKYLALQVVVVLWWLLW